MRQEAHSEGRGFSYAAPMYKTEIPLHINIAYVCKVIAKKDNLSREVTILFKKRAVI